MIVLTLLLCPFVRIIVVKFHASIITFPLVLISLFAIFLLLCIFFIFSHNILKFGHNFWLWLSSCKSFKHFLSFTSLLLLKFQSFGSFGFFFLFFTQFFSFSCLPLFFFYFPFGIFNFPLLIFRKLFFWNFRLL